jgi:hypothetical protein
MREFTHDIGGAFAEDSPATLGDLVSIYDTALMPIKATTLRCPNLNIGFGRSSTNPDAEG